MSNNTFLPEGYFIENQNPEATQRLLNLIEDMKLCKNPDPEKYFKERDKNRLDLWIEEEHKFILNYLGSSGIITEIVIDEHFNNFLRFLKERYTIILEVNYITKAFLEIKEDNKAVLRLMNSLEKKELLIDSINIFFN